MKTSRDNQDMDAGGYEQEMMIRTTGAGGTLRLSPAFAKRFGYDSDALRSKPLEHFIHPEDRPAFDEVCLEGGCVTARMETHDGQWVEVDWTCRAGDETALLGRVGHGFPAELARRSLVIPHPPSPISETLDAMARIVESKNPGLRCSILLVDQKCEYIMGGAGPHLPDAYNEAIEGLRAGPAVGSCGTATYWNVPVVVEDIRSDPLWRDLRDEADIAKVAACWSHPVISSDGQMLGAMALYADEPQAPTAAQMDGLEIAARMVGLAVERDALEEQLRQAAKLEALGVLAGGVAHDFNNLLAAILGNIELAMSDVDRPFTRELLSEAETASLRAAELCEQMLAFAGRGLPSLDDFDFNDVVREMGKLLGSSISKKIDLDYDLADSTLGIYADRSQIGQIVMNLITNAADAIGSEQGRVVLRTTAREWAQHELEAAFPSAGLQAGEYVCFEVRDDGVGMSGDTLGRIFDPFFSTKMVGRGLGLAAARGIVKAHAGGIAVESAKGIGTTFRVVLPRQAALPEAHPRVEPVTSGRGRTVLVVDDEPAIRETTEAQLRRVGYEVMTASDGAEAVEVFGRSAAEIDCVVLDFGMPKLDGVEAFLRMRTIRDDIPVILTSGYTEYEISERPECADLAGFLQKPVRAKDLRAKVAEVVERGAAAASQGRA